MIRWAFALAVVLAAPAAAQVGPYRRFTEPAIDPNRNNRIIYAPVFSSFSERKPPQRPHDVASASWYLRHPGERDAVPDSVRDDGSYRLERFEGVRLPGESVDRLRVTIIRRPAPPPGLPQIRVIHRDSALTSLGFPTVESIPGGVRYTFLVMSPHVTAALPDARLGTPGVDSFDLRFMPAHEVRLPPHLVRAPTFSGAEPEVRQVMPPPRLPYLERVAGKRIEYRSGRVIQAR